MRLFINKLVYAIIIKQIHWQLNNLCGHRMVDDDQIR